MSVDQLIIKEQPLVEPISKLSKAKAYVASKAKKWAVDGAAFGVAYTPYRAIVEMAVLQDFDKMLHARINNIPVFLFGGPIFELRDAYRKYIWGITPESPKWKKTAADYGFSLKFQLVMYAPVLISAGVHDPKQILGAIGINLALNPIYQAKVAFPAVDKAEKYFGVKQERYGQEVPKAIPTPQ